MGKVRTYQVTLHPAKKLPVSASGFSGYATSFSLGSHDPPPRTVIEAAGLAELREKVQAFATASGVPVYEMEKEGEPVWAASVRVADGGRKPNGFDAEFAGMKHLFFPEPQPVK